MKSTLPRLVIPLLCVLASMYLFTACATDEKAEVVEQTWECMANADDPEVFETSMRMMFPTASNLEEAKEQYIYVSQAASLQDLEAARDEACGGVAAETSNQPVRQQGGEQSTEQATPTSDGSQPTEQPAPTATTGSQPTEQPTPTSAAAISSGLEHTCGLREDGSTVCWGNDAWDGRQARRKVRPSRPSAAARTTPAGCGKPARRCAGALTRGGRQARRKVRPSRPSAAVAGTPAGCGKTARWCAGARTTLARHARQRERPSRLSAAAGSIRPAGCGETARWCAGARTRMARQARQRGERPFAAISSGGELHLRGVRGDELGGVLGQRRGWRGKPAGG